MLYINKKLLWRIFLVILIAATLFFIWSNSLADAAESSEQSDSVIKIAKPIVDPKDRISDDVFERLVRKTAHFTEFAALGAEMMLLLSTFDRFNKKMLLSCVGICFAVAAADELLQLTSAGRACRFTDMLIDTAGALTGALFILLVRWIFGKISHKKIHK